MTYNVFGGTLNPTLLYYLVAVPGRLLKSCVAPSLCVAPATVRISGVEAFGTLGVRRTVVNVNAIHLHQTNYQFRYLLHKTRDSIPSKQSFRTAEHILTV